MSAVQQLPQSLVPGLVQSGGKGAKVTEHDSEDSVRDYKRLGENINGDVLVIKEGNTLYEVVGKAQQLPQSIIPGLVQSGGKGARAIKHDSTDSIHHYESLEKKKTNGDVLVILEGNTLYEVVGKWGPLKMAGLRPGKTIRLADGKSAKVIKSHNKNNTFLEQSFVTAGKLSEALGKFLVLSIVLKWLKYPGAAGLAQNIWFYGSAAVGGLSIADGIRAALTPVTVKNGK
jgi:hypothetical protein